MRFLSRSPASRAALGSCGCPRRPRARPVVGRAIPCQRYVRQRTPQCGQEALPRASENGVSVPQGLPAYLQVRLEAQRAAFPDPASPRQDPFLCVLSGEMCFKAVTLAALNFCNRCMDTITLALSDVEIQLHMCAQRGRSRSRGRGTSQSSRGWSRKCSHRVAGPARASGGANAEQGRNVAVASANL